MHVIFLPTILPLTPKPDPNPNQKVPQPQTWSLLKAVYELDRLLASGLCDGEAASQIALAREKLADVSSRLNQEPMQRLSDAIRALQTAKAGCTCGRCFPDPDSLMYETPHKSNGTAPHQPAQTSKP